MKVPSYYSPLNPLPVPVPNILKKGILVLVLINLDLNSITDGVTNKVTNK